MTEVVDIEERRRQAVLAGIADRVIQEEDDGAKVAAEREAEAQRLRRERGLIRSEVARLAAARSDAVAAAEESARALVANLRNVIVLGDQIQNCAVRLGKPGTLMGITGQGLRTEFSGYMGRLFSEAFGLRFGQIEWHSGSSTHAPWVEQEQYRLGGGIAQLLKDDDHDKD